ncbi:hypothetical protein KFK09_020639 [Dendrobium nobile]|uniref:Uncharacterized protein n=1 Tax=Dendrobium nobile TaxID=94219 RepID=A0A8T3ATK4_DENNO|nr:hypothetical protein KFK09_020639 [Dendrobium nobile]
MARAHSLLLYAVEVAPPQLIRVAKHKNKPSRTLETIMEEDKDQTFEGFSSSANEEKSATRN